MRAFIAVELSESCRRALADLLRRFAQRGREVGWCRPEQLHITLKFLGEVDAERLPAVHAAIERASGAVAPFALRLGGVGVFPPRGAPRVLWGGVEDAAEGCRRWVEAADPLLAEAGFEREQRTYVPHVTLARSRGPRGADVLRACVATGVAPEPAEMTVDRIVLYESEPRPDGARYSVRFAAALGGS